MAALWPLLGDFLGIPWGFMGRPWGSLWRLWAALGTTFGAHRAHSWRNVAILGTIWGKVGRLSAHFAYFGAPVVPFGGHLADSEQGNGTMWFCLDAPWELL